MKRDRSAIEAAKAKLPLPEVLRALGFSPPAGGEGNMPSPFAKGRRQKTDSFSVFRHGDAWGWCDRTGGGEEKGDEISFLEKLEGLTPAAAIARYLALAGVASAPLAATARQGKAKVPDSAPPDWPAAVAKFSPDHAARLATWRGLSAEFVAWLKAQGLIGICKDSTAFPTHREDGALVAAHIRPESGRWFYSPKGAGSHPLTIGNPATAAKTLLFESQWDAFAIIDAMGWHRAAPAGLAVLITRGASNGKFAARAGGQIIAFPQNDPAGAQWLADVAASARGEVLEVRTPAPHKDANDWCRAGAVDVAAAIAAASPVATPEVPPILALAPSPAGHAAANSAQPPPAFDPVAVLDEMGLFWLDGSSFYFVRRQDRGQVRFTQMGAAEIKRKLKVRGLRSRPDPDSGETLAPIDRLLDAATEHHAVDFAVNVAGTPAGLYDFAGARVLVRESPRLIEPEAGDFPTIETFITGLLGGDGALLLCGWLRIAFEALRAGERRPGQALIIVGPPDCGKSRIQHQIVTPILGGRSADPKAYLFGRTDFNSELIGAEHLLIEEIPPSSKMEDRETLGERIKEVVGNDTARLHKKNRDACSVPTFWRLSVTLNDDNLRCLPPLKLSLLDKIIILSAAPAPEFWEQFASAPDPRKAFREAIERELPAFAPYLITMKIEDRFKSRRFGVTHYIPEELARAIHEGEPEFHLAMLIDKAGLFEDGEAWQGDAEDLRQTLCAEGSPVKDAAGRLLKQLALSTIGKWLALLETQTPRRYKFHRTGNARKWIIQPPPADQAGSE